VLAAGLFWPDLHLVVLGLGLAGLIAWSRLHLARHTFADLVAGVLAGGVAAGAFQFFLAGP